MEFRLYFAAANHDWWSVRYASLLCYIVFVWRTYSHAPEPISHMCRTSRI